MAEQSTETEQLQQVPTETKDFGTAPAAKPQESAPAATEQHEKKKGGFGGWLKNNFVRKANDGYPNQKEYSWEPPHPRYKS